MKPVMDHIAAIGFSASAVPLLRRLQESGFIREIRWPGEGGSSEPTAGWLASRWSALDGLVAVGACGLVTRLIAPLLSDKQSDPAVVVVDPQGRYAVPLLGGHAAGAETLSRQLAALLGGEAVLTGACASEERLPLDSFGTQWGWLRGAGDWSALMVAAAAAGPAQQPILRQEAGISLWQSLEAAPGAVTNSSGHPPPSDSPPSDSRSAEPPAGADAGEAPSLVIGPHTGPGCRWHPPCLWLGVGCERDTSLPVLDRLLERTLTSHGLARAAVAGVASVDRKRDEAALLQLCEREGWPLRLFAAAELARVPVPHPSEVVAQEMGTASVAEAAALLAAGPAAGIPAQAERLWVSKTIERAHEGERGAATLAVCLAERQWAPRRGSLHLVGSGPGDLGLLSGDARQALAGASAWVGYGPYLDRLEPLRRADQLRRDGRLTEERERCQEALDLACQGLSVALVSSGDSGIYGMAGLALELWLALPAAERPAFEVHPGLSALQLAAARVGAPLMHDFCTISLSDRLTPWPVIERRLRAAAEGDFVVALYNPRSLGRDWQLGRARALLQEKRPASTPVVVARQLGREGEAVRLHTLGSLPLEEVDMLTLVLIGNSSSYVRDRWMVTPRGYPGAELA